MRKSSEDAHDVAAPRKRRKLQDNEKRASQDEWSSLKENARLFGVQHVLNNGKFAFQYLEGPVVKAIREGSWYISPYPLKESSLRFRRLLLDEINLASSETLECIVELLQGPEASITLAEKGSLEPVPRHPEFRIFGCMNPAMGIGKKTFRLISEINSPRSKCQPPMMMKRCSLTLFRTISLSRHR